MSCVALGAIDTETDDSAWNRDVPRRREPAAVPAGERPLTDGMTGTAADVARRMRFRSSDAWRRVTGAELWIDGGHSLPRG